MKILAVIPARSGSKGIPEKNIKLLGKFPLIAYSIKTALKSKLLDKIIVSTDSEKIAKIALQYGAEVPFLRPKELAMDTTPTLPVLEHALHFFLQKNETYDAICLLQPTSPFRTVDFLNQAINKFIELKPDSLVSVREVPHEFNPHWIFEPDKNNFLKISTGDEKIIPRRQDLPKAYYRDGSIYIINTNTILKKNNLLGNRIAYIETPENIPYVNLDTPEDWKIAEKIIKNVWN